MDDKFNTNKNSKAAKNDPQKLAGFDTKDIKYEGPKPKSDQQAAPSITSFDTSGIDVQGTVNLKPQPTPGRLKPKTQTTTNKTQTNELGTLDKILQGEDTQTLKAPPPKPTRLNEERIAEIVKKDNLQINNSPSINDIAKLSDPKFPKDSRASDRGTQTNSKNKLGLNDALAQSLPFIGDPKEEKPKRVSSKKNGIDKNVEKSAATKKAPKPKKLGFWSSLLISRGLAKPKDLGLIKPKEKGDSHVVRTKQSKEATSKNTRGGPS